MPIVVVILFLAATYVPRFFVDPPQYDFLFSDQGGGAISRWSYAVDVDDQQRVRAHALWQGSEGYRTRARLFIYEHEVGRVREIRMPLPEAPAMAEQEPQAVVRVAVDIPALRDLIVDERRVAPDGYEFSEPEHRGRGGLGLFYSGRPAHPTISKNGAVVKIDLPHERSYYNSIRFHGWVLPTSEQ